MMQRLSLPHPLSAYALVAFEGHLYLFGGWDSQGYVNAVYSYDPSRDEWHSLMPMPTGRGYAGAAVAGRQLFIIGGYDGKNILAVNEVYSPDQDNGVDNPWEIEAPLPEGRYAMGIASMADMIHVIGGIGPAHMTSTPLEFIPSTNTWQVFGSPWNNPGLISVWHRLVQSFTLLGANSGVKRQTKT